MSARIFIRQNDVLYRLLTIEQANEGSVYLSIGRDVEPRDTRRWNEVTKSFETYRCSTKGGRQISYHVSGKVNYEPVISTQPLFFEPLFDITHYNCFLLLSVPRVSRLHLAKSNVQGPSGVVDVPSGNFRVTVGIAVGPAGSDGQDLGAHVRVGYDTFAV